jgi:large conductance mechanosensitive channel
MRALAKDFRAFLVRGNLVDMAVGIVIGIAFAALVSALVKDLITPIIAALAGKHDFSALSFAIHGSRFLYGDFINAVVAFVSIAAAVFFFVVKPVTVLTERLQKEEPAADETVRACPECLSQIPREASRCAFCTTQVAPALGSRQIGEVGLAPGRLERAGA